MSDRRATSKARLRAGLRCFKFYGCDVGVPEVLDALHFDGADTCAGLTAMFAQLVAEHKRAIESDGDMSLRVLSKSANIDQGDLDEKD